MPLPEHNTQSTPLEDRLKKLISLHGPINLATYMAQALGDPTHGYYTTQTAIGRKGDFITAPEVSQLFGEIIGVWLLAQWQQQGQPEPFHIAELGPGRGTLMQDIIRTLCTFPQAAKSLRIHLVEMSDSLRQEQADKLAPVKHLITWHDTIDSLPDAPIFLVANEFFDALPIHHWIFHENRWHERIIGLNEQKELAFGLGAVRDLVPHHPLQPSEGSIWEHCPMADAITQSLAAHLATHGGAALIIDYGYLDHAYGDTFQAIKDHAYADPLIAPGQQDLTAHVNFAALKQSIAKQQAASEADSETNALQVATTTQGEFLLNLGLLQRAGQLGAGKNHDDQEAIRDEVERLAAPDQMGELFKVLTITKSDSPIAGF